MVGDNPLTALPPAWLHDVTPAVIIPSSLEQEVSGPRPACWGDAGVLGVGWMGRDDAIEFFVASPNSERANNGALARLG
jgi:hypothetical protein